MAKKKQPAYPEHLKLHAVKERSQSIGEFMAWLEETKQYCLATRHAHTEYCKNSEGQYNCHLGSGELVEPMNAGINKLLAEFFGIDLQVLEAEKLDMLEEQRAINEKQQAKDRKDPFIQAEAIAAGVDLS